MVHSSTLLVCPIALVCAVHCVTEHLPSSRVQKFSKEQVTLNELQLMTEQHLVELGIPMGPRLAILSEIQSLESVSFED